MRHKIILTLIILGYFILGGCSMNKFFLYPSKISHSMSAFKIHSELEDSSYIVMVDTANDYQPAFYDTTRTPINIGFDIKSVIFKSESGSSINGWWLTPKKIKYNATFIFFHGNSGSLYSQYQLISPLVLQGFRVFIFDYSGFGFSTGKATRNNLLKDGVSAIQYVCDSLKDPQATYIYGQSYGGQLSIASYLQSNRSLKGIVTEGTFSNFKDIAKYNSGIFGKLIVSKGYSADKLIETLNIPILLIHSEDDKTIPFSMGKYLYGKARQPKDFVKINGEHCHGLILYSDNIINKMISFFNLEKIK